METVRIRLEALDPARGRFRAYRIDAGPDLFGAWLVELKGLITNSLDTVVLQYYDITMLTSRLTSKFQATIPGRVREILGIGRGDTIAFSVADGRVILQKVEPVDTDFLRLLDRALEDWNSPEDDHAFRNL